MKTAETAGDDHAGHLESLVARHDANVERYHQLVRNLTGWSCRPVEVGSISRHQHDRTGLRGLASRSAGGWCALHDCVDH